MSEKQDSGQSQADEDDLLADLSDLLGEEDKGTMRADNADDGLAALDAFLEEFGQGSPKTEHDLEADAAFVDAAQVAEEAEAAAQQIPELDVAADTQAEAPAEAAAGEGLDLDLGEEDIVPATDHATPDGSGDDLFAEAAPEPEAIADMEVPTAAVAAAAGAATAVAAGNRTETSAASVTQPRPGRDVSTMGVAVFALVIAVGAVWFSTRLNGQVAELSTRLDAVNQTPVVMPGGDPQTQQALASLEQRLGELAVLVEGPMSHMSESAKREREAMLARIDEVEKAVATLRERSAKVVKATPVPAAPPAAPTTATAPAPAKKSAAPRGNWVVNLASLSDEKSAREELARMKRAGIDAELQTAVSGGKTWYRLRVMGFASREEAQAYGDKVRSKIGGQPWVGRN